MNYVTTGLPYQSDKRNRIYDLQMKYYIAEDYQKPFRDMWYRGYQHFMCRLDLTNFPSRFTLCQPLIKSSIMAIVAAENQTEPNLLVTPMNPYVDDEIIESIRQWNIQNWKRAGFSEALTTILLHREMFGTAFVKPYYEKRVHWEKRWLPKASDLGDARTWELEMNRITNTFQDETGNPNYVRELQNVPVVDFDGVNLKIIEPGWIMVPPGCTSFHYEGGGRPPKYVIERDILDVEDALRVPYYDQEAVRRYVAGGSIPKNFADFIQFASSMGINLTDSRVPQIPILRYYFLEQGTQIDMPFMGPDIFYEGENIYGGLPFARFVSQEHPGQFWGTPRWRDGEDLYRATQWAFNWETEFLGLRSQPMILASEQAFGNQRDLNLQAGGIIRANLGGAKSIDDVARPFMLPAMDPLNLNLRYAMISAYEEAVQVPKGMKGTPDGRGSPTAVMEAAQNASSNAAFNQKYTERGVNDMLALVQRHMRRNVNRSGIIPMSGRRQGQKLQEFFISPEILAPDYAIMVENKSLNSGMVEERERALVLESLKLLSEAGLMYLMDSRQVAYQIMEQCKIPKSRQEKLLKDVEQVAQEQQMMMAQMQQQEAGASA